MISMMETMQLDTENGPSPHLSRPSKPHRDRDRELKTRPRFSKHSSSSTSTPPSRPNSPYPSRTPSPYKRRSVRGVGVGSPAGAAQSTTPRSRSIPWSQAPLSLARPPAVPKLPPPPTLSLILPARLPRQPLPRVDPQRMADPALRGIPLPYLAELFKLKGVDVIRSLRGARVSRIVEGGLEAEVEWSGEGLGEPTVVWAVHQAGKGIGKEGKEGKEKGYLLPAHASLYTLFCAFLPPIPTPTTTSPSSSVPIVPLPLPSPATLPLLHMALHAPSPAPLLKALLHPSAADTRPPGELAAQEIVDRLKRVHALWGNVVAMGCVDEGVWRAMEMAWGALVGELRGRYGGGRT